MDESQKERHSKIEINPGTTTEETVWDAAKYIILGLAL